MQRGRVLSCFQPPPNVSAEIGRRGQSDYKRKGHSEAVGMRRGQGQAGERPGVTCGRPAGKGTFRGGGGGAGQHKEAAGWTQQRGLNTSGLSS